MKNSQKGFMLIAAMFLLIVLSFLGIAMTTMATVRDQEVAMDTMGTRAYQAALAGLEWVSFQVANSPINAVAPAACAPTISQGNLGGALSKFAVAVTCQTTAVTEYGATVWIYNITSSATTGSIATNDYVRRDVSIRMMH